MEKSFSLLPQISHTENLVKQTVVGQDKAIRQIVTTIFKSQFLHITPCVSFIIGGSGTGKTLTFQTLSKFLDVPFTIESATQFSETGYVGASVEDMLIHLLEKSREFTENFSIDQEIAERGFLIIDEIGKKVTKNGKTVGRDISGESVLNSLLPILNGDVVPIKYKVDSYEEKHYMFNTKNLIIFLVDACVGIDEIRDKRLGEKIDLGFSKPKELSLRKASKEFLEEDLINYGFVTELVGRVNYDIIEFTPISEETLVSILENSEQSPFMIHKKRIEEYGVQLTYYDDIFKDIAKAGAEGAKVIGARVLNKIVNKLFEEIIYLLFDTPSGISKISLEKGILEDNGMFLIL